MSLYLPTIIAVEGVIIGSLPPLVTVQRKCIVLPSLNPAKPLLPVIQFICQSVTIIVIIIISTTTIIIITTITTTITIIIDNRKTGINK